MCGSLDAPLGFLLKRVDDPDFLSDLDSVDDAESITPEGERDLKDAGAETVYRFRDIRFAAVRCDGKGREKDGLCVFGEGLKCFQRRLDP